MVRSSKKATGEKKPVGRPKKVATYRLKRKDAALPELAVHGTARDDGKRWTIDELMDGPARCSPENRSLVIPLGTSKRDRDTVLHELGHARNSPDTSAPEVVALVKEHGQMRVQASEDARTNTYLRDNVRKHDYTEGSWVKEATPERVSDMTLEQLACLQVAHRGLESYDKVHRALRKALTKIGRTDLAKALKELDQRSDRIEYHYNTDDFRFTEEIAEAVSEIVGKYEPDGDTPVGKTPAPTGIPGEEKLGEPGKVFSPTPHGPGSEVPEACGSVPWCPMKISRPKLPRWHDAARRAMGYTAPSDHGTRIRFPQNILSGGRVFARRTPDALKGGTWLIDRSGSMHIDDDHIQTLIDAAPAATIAAYDGNGVVGKLTVLAFKGRCVNPADPEAGKSGGGNCVDGPALRWLLQQQEPRIWVCDGIVTGERDEASPALKRECEALCRVGNVRQIYSIDLATNEARAVKKAGRRR